jgi:hypothetical protein
MSSSDAMPFILMGGGVLVIFVAYGWLQDEIDSPNRGAFLVYDLIASGRSFGFTLFGFMVGGACMVHLGWKSLR